MLKIIGGDFNDILFSQDKRGGLLRVRWSQKDFREWINRNRRLEIDLGEDIFTLKNRCLPASVFFSGKYLTIGELRGSGALGNWQIVIILPRISE